MYRPLSTPKPQAVLSVPGVDACFVGPVDLSHALGLAQSLGFPACFDSPQFKVAGRQKRVPVRAAVLAGLTTFACSLARAPCCLFKSSALLACVGVRQVDYSVGTCLM